MSHTAERTLLQRPAALTVAALHAGLILVLLTSIRPPYIEPSIVPFEPVPMEPDPPRPRTVVDVAGPTDFEKPQPREKEPIVVVEDEISNDPGPGAIDQPPPGIDGPKVETDDTRAEILSRTEIDYPVRAIRGNEQGVVLLKVRVGADGRPREVVIERSSGHSSLDQAARRAVARWKFKPPTRGGIPVEAWTLLPVTFQLKG